MNKRNIIINSTLLFSIAFIWQMTLHELGHFIAGVLLHSKNTTLFHNYVSQDFTGLTVSSQIIIVAAGPFFSLFIGALFQIICSNYKKRNSLFLFLLYMSAFGYICFGGYLMISPFFQEGDTGFIFHLLGFPLWLTIVFAILGVAFIFLISKVLSKYYAEMATAEIMNDKQKLKIFATTLIKYPLYIGVVLATLLNLPVTVFLSLFYPLGNPMNMFWVYGYVTDTKFNTDNANKQFDKLNKIQPGLIIPFVLTIIVNRLLVYGFHF